MVKWLLREGGSQIEERTREGTTALLFAAAKGKLEIVQWLLREGGSHIDERDIHGNTALLYAAARGELETVQWLLREGGSQIEERNRKGITALLFAAGFGQLETVQWLLKNAGSQVQEKSENDNTALLLAAGEGRLETVQWLLQEGGSQIDERNIYGNTILLRAAIYGHLKIVKWLLEENGIRINEKNKKGHMALFLAASEAHLETLQFLITHPKMRYVFLKEAINELHQGDVVLKKVVSEMLDRALEAYESCMEEANSDMPRSYYKVINAKVVISRDMYCPISLGLMEDPVICLDGHVYERTQIARWFESNDTSPLTNEQLQKKDLIPALHIKRALSKIHELVDTLYQKKQAYIKHLNDPARKRSASVTLGLIKRKPDKDVSFQNKMQTQSFFKSISYDGMIGDCPRVMSASQTRLASA